MTSEGNTGMGLYHGNAPADIPREAPPTRPRTPQRPSPFAQSREQET